MFFSTLSFWKPHKPSERITAFQPQWNQPLISPVNPPKRTHEPNLESSRSHAVGLVGIKESRAVVVRVKPVVALIHNDGDGSPVAVLCHVMVGITTEVKSIVSQIHHSKNVHNILIKPYWLVFLQIAGICFVTFMNFIIFHQTSSCFLWLHTPPFRHLLLRLCLISISKVRFGCVSKEILHLSAAWRGMLDLLGKLPPKDPLRTLLPGSGWVKLTCMNGVGCLGPQKWNV